jgi:hypothetical protein
LKFQHFPVHLVGDGESDMEKRDFKAKIGDFGLAEVEDEVARSRGDTKMGEKRKRAP